jgi:protein-S-isoprenylcysteine O-methyltransferase Ste14
MEFYPLLIKSIALLMTATSVHLSLSPPNPPVKRDECTGSRTHTFFERLIQWITFTSKTMVWIGALWDLTTSLIAFYNTSCSPSMAAPVDYSKFRLSSERGQLLSALWAIHPIMLIGTFATVSAAILRIWCFKTLGPMFTFEVSIRPQHQLVTHGPYAWVRHPSYIGVYLTLLGATAVLCAPGGWLSSGGWLTPLGCLMVAIWTIKCLYVFRGTSLRLQAEDDILKAAFGQKWEEYARKVPYKLVPYLI